MRTFVLALGLCFGFAATAAPAPAQAQTPAQPPAQTQTPAQAIAPADAKAHAGQTVTVEGDISNVHKIANGITFIDMGGKFPDNTFTAVILATDAAKFPDVSALNGKTVDVTGQVRLYKGKPSVLLTDPAQLKAK